MIEEKELEELEKLKKQKTEKELIEQNPIMKKAGTKVFINILIAILIMVYFVGLFLGNSKLSEETFSRGLQIITMILLLGTIILFELAYKKDDGMLAINGIELLVLSCHALSIPYIIEVFELEFGWYATVSAYVFAIYFVFKSILVYAKGKGKYLRSLSDISEIVKEEKPRKKEATKKRHDDNEKL